MRVTKSQYIPINYAELPNGVNVIEAHQGAGKTQRINDLVGQSNIVVGARVELGGQLIERCPTLNFEHYHHLLDEELHKATNLFICYPSLHRLHGKDFSLHNFDNLIIDEANLVWGSSFKFIPRNSNNIIFRRLIQQTPRVIVVGASFDGYVLEDLEAIKPMFVISPDSQ